MQKLRWSQARVKIGRDLVDLAPIGDQKLSNSIKKWPINSSSS